MKKRVELTRDEAKKVIRRAVEGADFPFDVWRKLGGAEGEVARDRMVSDVQRYVSALQDLGYEITPPKVEAPYRNAAAPYNKYGVKVPINWPGLMMLAPPEKQSVIPRPDVLGLVAWLAALGRVGDAELLTAKHAVEKEESGR